MSNAIWSNDSSASVTFEEPLYDPKSYRCHIAIIKDDEDSFSVIVLNLPGAGSCGATEEEAIENTREAVAGLVSHYLEEGDIPWVAPDSYDIPSGAKQKWILVDA